MPDSQTHNTPEIQTREDLSPKILVTDLEKNRAEWLKLREKKISSSNAAVVCGISPWKSPLQLWAEWTGKITDSFKGNRATQLGTALEPLVASWFAERNGVEVRHGDALFVDSELSWLVATPDYLIPSQGDIPLEIKTGNWRTAYKWADGAAPYEYVLQLQIQMRVLQKPRGILTAYLGDFDSMPDVKVEYDPELFALVREKAEAFLECVRTDMPPVAGAGDAELLRVITKREEGRIAEWSSDQANLVELLVIEAREAAEVAASIRKELEKVDKQKKELENRIKQALGSATLGKLPDGRMVKLNTVHVAEKLVGAYSYDRLSLPKTA